MLLIIFCSSMCFGTGSCTNIPETSSETLSLSINFKSSSSEVSAGRAYSKDLIPISSQAFFLLFTYTRLAGSSPTIITARPGLIPLSFSLSASSFNCAFILAETSLPFSNCAIFIPPVFVF